VFLLELAVEVSTSHVICRLEVCEREGGVKERVLPKGTLGTANGHSAFPPNLAKRAASCRRVYPQPLLTEIHFAVLERDHAARQSN
jgi:hypothetical protein